MADLSLTEAQANASPYGETRSTVPLSSSTLSPAEEEKTDAYMRACLYLCIGMIYLRENPLLREPLSTKHLKARLLGHWGSDPGQVFTYIHMNRLIKKYDLDALFISGPGESIRYPTCTFLSD
jgi:xylulose-5-phosphate/fructose-6-phosphate phosphoketolase